MIAVRLEGGLGNQLFQHAAGRALALRHGTGVLWDMDALLRPPAGVTPRHFELDRFRVQGGLARAGQVRGMRWLRRLGPAAALLSPWRAHRESSGGYDPDFTRLGDASYLVGYWQSFRYFESCAAQLSTEFEPAQAMSAASELVLSDIRRRESVAVHVRRGDYVSRASAATYHGVLEPAYYRAALSRLAERHKALAVQVFSDDPDWCRQHLALPFSEVNFVSHNQGEDAWQDLVLMAACRHHVIANSSFSWWGAWLADQRQQFHDRQVFAPAQWFTATPIAPTDRFPAHWQVLG
jgi:hypothetical protein